MDNLFSVLNSIILLVAAYMGYNALFNKRGRKVEKDIKESNAKIDKLDVDTLIDLANSILARRNNKG